MRVTLYVPRPGTPLASNLERGAAIAGNGPERDSGFVPVAVEERRFGESLGSTYADRVERAAEKLGGFGGGGGRRLRAEELVAVATFDRSRGEVRIEYERQAAALAGWLGVSALDEAELQTTRSVLGALRQELLSAPAPVVASRRSRGFHSE
ncbi:MAG TPA: hypothetical protein VGF23_07970 [Gaiellaceae bacterium]|jgi:hypothetical protein